MNNQYITVNLIPNLSAPAVACVSQYDVGRPLVFRVYNGVTSADLTGVTAVAVGTKKSGLGFSVTGTISGNTVTFNSTLEMTQESGMIPAEIRFSKTGEDIGTANFTLAVEPSPHLEGTTDGTTETMADLQSQLDALDERVEALEAGGSGLTQAEKQLILTLFCKAAYAEDDAGVVYDALEALWTTTTRTITYNLSHVSSSNSMASIENGQSYTTTLTASTNYTLNSVSVTMGGVDITSTAYSSGTVSIPSVTGNIVITATAVLAAQSITATYTQSGTVYTTDSLDSLKADLVVTANFAGGTSETVPASDYTLSGTLAEGTSTITVSYAGLTTTFTVDCTVKGWLYHFNESIESSGEDDFNLVGTGVYDTGLFNKKCYKHFTPTSGTASTDTQYGLYAKNLTKVLDYGHDFTISCWMATQKNGYCHLYDQTIARGNTYPSNRYFSEVTKINQDWGNLSHGQSTNNNAGILIFMGTQSNNIFLAVRLANSELTASSYVGINIPSSVDTRDWHHYALTRKGDKVRMFFDGEILWEATASESTIYDSQQCAISTNFNTSTNNIQQMPNGEKLQDLYIAPFCKWEADFDTSAITY